LAWGTLRRQSSGAQAPALAGNRFVQWHGCGEVDDETIISKDIGSLAPQRLGSVPEWEHAQPLMLSNR